MQINAVLKLTAEVVLIKVIVKEIYSTSNHIQVSYELPEEKTPKQNITKTVWVVCVYLFHV